MRAGVPAILTALLFATASHAQSINVGTGLDASGNVQYVAGDYDANYVVNGASTVTDGTAAQVLAPGAPNWYSGWLANGPNSSWIGATASNQNNGPAPYSFVDTFNLTGYDLATVALSGGWAADDAGSLYLNGNLVSSVGDGAWGALTAFSALNQYFVQGLNTLTITLTTSDEYLEGVRLDGIVTGQQVGVPEPASLALLGAGVLGFLAVRRRSA